MDCFLCGIILGNIKIKPKSRDLLENRNLKTSSQKGLYADFMLQEEKTKDFMHGPTIVQICMSRNIIDEQLASVKDHILWHGPQSAAVNLLIPLGRR